MNDIRCEWCERNLTLIGRVLLAVIFIVAGIGKLMDPAATAGYMASQGLPMVDVLLWLTILVELGGGLMLLVGYRARLAALFLFLFLIPVTFIFHAFWAVEPAESVNQMRQFLKNLAIMGGLLYVMAFGAGPLSLDQRRP
jgi:putative oxidoreductase